MKTKTEELFRKKSEIALAADDAKHTYYTQLHHQAALHFTASILQKQIGEVAVEQGLRAADVFINQLKERDK